MASSPDGESSRLSTSDRSSLTARDLQNEPRGIAQLKDIARVALDREILIERADERVVRLEDHAIVGNLRDGAARRLREEPCTAASADGGVHLVAMHQGRAPAAAGCKAFRRHLQHAVE